MQAWSLRVTKSNLLLKLTKPCIGLLTINKSVQEVVGVRLTKQKKIINASQEIKLNMRHT